MMNNKGQSLVLFVVVLPITLMILVLVYDVGRMSLLKNELNYILCVVTRYFGGIKLGASGLVRAYRNSIVEALKLCKFYELVDGYTLEINTTYDNQKKIDFLIKDLEYKKDYFTNIKYTIKCPKDKIKILDDNNIKYNILEKNKIEI